MAADELARFDRTERVVHWATAVLGLVLVATGAALYAGPVSTLVGRRDLMRTVHVAAGLLLVVPTVVAVTLPRHGRALRADLGRLNRFDVEDGRWLVPNPRARATRPAKFNAGQKLNAAFLAAAGLALLGTGLMLRWPEPFSVDLRTGATFVHDWTAIAATVAVAGHIVMGLKDPVALRAMVRGRVPATWARRRHPRWYESETGERADRLASPKAPSAAGTHR